MNEWDTSIDRDQLAHCLATHALWLSAMERRSGSRRTRREYERVWHTFYGTAHGYKLAPWAVDVSHVQTWATELSRRLAPASVNKSLSIMSSWYRFGLSQRLWKDANPFTGDDLRAHVGRYERSRYPSTDQVWAIRDVIDTSSALGQRDLALYLGMFSTTRRVSEWLALRWCDITGDTFTCRIKGGRLIKQIFPDGLLGQISAWLTAAGNYPPAPNDYVFAAPGHWDRPLHPGYVNRRLRKLGRLAGVPAHLCHCHGLRHAGARFLRQRGASTWELQQILCHRSPSTTEIYCRQVLDEPEDRLAGAFVAFFGVSSDARIQSSRVSPVPASHSLR